MPEHSTWIVQEEDRVLTIEVVADCLVVTTKNSFVARWPTTRRDLHRKIGMAVARMECDEVGP